MNWQLIKYWLVGILMAFLCHDICAQHVTKEQLLKLFYQANVAQKANDTDKAIEIYLSVLKLSPGLPDPYLSLGKLYAAKSDKVSMKKACICYSNYLRLKPDASDADFLKSEITRLTALAEAEETTSPVIENEPPRFTVVLASPIEESDSIAMEDSVYVAEAPIEPVVEDTVATVAEPVKPEVIAPIDSRMLGRWASDEMNSNGREMWIFDIHAENNALWMQLTDSAFMKKDVLWANAPDLKAQGLLEGDSIVFAFEMEEEKKVLSSSARKEEKANDDFTTIVDEILNLDLGRLMEVPNPGKEMAKADTTAMIDSLAVDSIPADSVIRLEPRIVHAYIFRFAFDGKMLGGSVTKRIYDANSPDEVPISENSRICELFKAPDDYQGFTYTRPSDSELSNMPELCEIYNQKRRTSESMSSLNDLACLTMWGVGTHRNIRMALSYFMEASMKNNLFATLNLAQLYQDGYGVEKNLPKARELYMRAFKSGYTDALVLCGDTYWESEGGTDPDYQKALECYQKAMLRRCPYAAFRLGWLYNEGLGVEQDTARALNYYKQAVAMSYPDAMADMGSFYREGRLVEQDYAKAMEYLNKAAAKGNVKAMYEIYQMHLRGEGVQPNFNLAKEWLRKSMDADNSVLNGFSSVKNQIKAIIKEKNK